MWIVLVLLLGLAAGLWVAWQRGMLGEAALPGPLGALQEHLKREGIDTHAAVVRRGPWEGVRQHAIFRRVGQPDPPFFVVWFESPALAQKQRDRLLTAPSPSHPQVRGELLLYLTHWPADDPATRAVIDAFNRWPG